MSRPSLRRTYNADHGLRATHGHNRSQDGGPAEGEATVQPDDLAQAQGPQDAGNRQGPGGRVRPKLRRTTADLPVKVYRHTAELYF